MSRKNKQSQHQPFNEAAQVDASKVAEAEDREAADIAEATHAIVDTSGRDELIEDIITECRKLKDRKVTSVVGIFNAIEALDAFEAEVSVVESHTD